MAGFTVDNKGKGKHFVRHTSTGYEGVANHPANTQVDQRQVTFFARHTVGENGRPYTEIGVNGLSQDEHRPTKKIMKESLKEAGFKEAKNVVEHSAENRFFEFHAADPTSVTFCVTPQDHSIVSVVNVIDESIIDKEAKEFISHQEQVPDILYRSILHGLGEEMSRGPGGRAAAENRAKKLADYFINGTEQE